MKARVTMWRNSAALKRIGLAAAIVLGPGGFILGAALVVRHYRTSSRKSEAPGGEHVTSLPGKE